jgi:Ca2+-binding EF-hand superfamily protein
MLGTGPLIVALLGVIPTAHAEIRHLFSLYEDCTMVGGDANGNGGTEFCRAAPRDNAYIDGSWVCAIEVLQDDHFEEAVSLGNNGIPVGTCASHEICSSMRDFHDGYLTMKVSNCKLDIAALLGGLFFVMVMAVLFVFRERIGLYFRQRLAERRRREAEKAFGTAPPTCFTRLKAKIGIVPEDDGEGHTKEDVDYSKLRVPPIDGVFPEFEKSMSAPMQRKWSFATLITENIEAADAWVRSDPREGNNQADIYSTVSKNAGSKSKVHHKIYSGEWSSDDSASSESEEEAEDEELKQEEDELARKLYIKMKGEFDAADKDHNGYLDRREQELMFGEQKLDTKDESIQQYMRAQFKKLDRDGDGRVSLEEFMVEAGLGDLLAEDIMKQKRAQQYSNMRKYFEMADLDRDGYVSRYEMLGYFRKMLRKQDEVRAMC